MKCESKVSKFCKKIIRKDKAKFIGGKMVCLNCFEKIKMENKNGK